MCRHSHLDNFLLESLSIGSLLADFGNSLGLVADWNIAGLCLFRCYIWLLNLNSECFNLLIWTTTACSAWLNFCRNLNTTVPKWRSVISHLPSLRRNNFFFFEHLNRKCSTAAPHDSKPFIMFCWIVVAMCHIFPISRSPWDVWKCIQAHILFLLLVSDGDFQPERKERSHKHNVSLTQKQNLC